MATLKKGISLIIHTKNEEQNILECINSAKKIAAEIIVVDMRSSDNTVGIALNAGAKVYKVKDAGFADPTRNFGIRKASFEWILSLDADERLNPVLLETLLDVVKKGKYDVVKIPRKNRIFKKWVKHGMWWPDYQARFFRKGFLKHTGFVHSQPKYKGRVLTLPEDFNLAIAHYHRDSISDFLRMVDRYTYLEKTFTEDIVDKGELTSENLMKFLEHEFEWRFIQHKGYLDGMHGFVLSKFMNFYRFLEFAKYWEKNDFKELVNFTELKNLSIQYFSFENPSEIDDMRKQLNIILSSKFYKIWRLYCFLRDSMFNYMRKLI